MSKRPILKKRVAQIRRELRRTEPQSFVNVYNWMRLRGYAKSRDAAAQLVLEGRLRAADGTVLGILGPKGNRYAAGYIDSKKAEGMYLGEVATIDDLITPEVREKIAGQEASAFLDGEWRDEITSTNDLFAKAAERDRAKGRRSFGT